MLAIVEVFEHHYLYIHWDQYSICLWIKDFRSTFLLLILLNFLNHVFGHQKLSRQQAGVRIVYYNELVRCKQLHVQ